jgi:hypothetical protein
MEFGTITLVKQYASMYRQHAARPVNKHATRIHGWVEGKAETGLAFDRWTQDIISVGDDDATSWMLTAWELFLFQLTQVVTRRNRINVQTFDSMTMGILNVGDVIVLYMFVCLELTEVMDAGEYTIVPACDNFSEYVD